jgi:hypothetical protein
LSVTIVEQGGILNGRPIGPKGEMGGIPNAKRLLLVSAVILVSLGLSPRSNLLVYIFPIFSVVMAWTLLRNSRRQYTSFVLWLWFLDPFIRRMVDFRSGINSGAPILLAPYLASCVALYYVVRDERKLIKQRSIPLCYIFVAVLYGAVVGLFNFPVSAVLQGLLTWIAPLCFACFIYQERIAFGEIYRTFERTMIYGTLVAGTYGIYQFFAPTPWDKLWIETLGNPTFGFPEPMQVRVFSTMNAPQILALFLVAGILLALHSKNRLRFFAVSVGTLSLVFSMARTAWVSLVVGLIYLIVKAHARLRAQIFAAILMSLAAFGVALQDPRVALLVSHRIDTLSDVRHDDSFVVRIEGYGNLFAGIVDHPFGLGIGGQANGNDKTENEQLVSRGGKFVMQNDSTLAAIILSLGGAGTLLLSVSLGMLVLTIVRLDAPSGSPGEAIKMLSLVLASEFFFNNVIDGPSGFLSWTILSLGLAASSVTQRLRLGLAE